MICKYIDQKGLVAILTSIQSAGVTPEVNLRITLDRCHQKSKIGLSVAPQNKTGVLQKLIQEIQKKKKKKKKKWPESAFAQLLSKECLHNSSAFQSKYLRTFSDQKYCSIEIIQHAKFYIYTLMI